MDQGQGAPVSAYRRLASVLLIIEQPSLKVAALLAVRSGAFRFYYFAFYVIEHYVDASYRFSGL